MPQLHEMDLERESLLKLAELGLVMLLFTDASHIDLKTLQSRERLPLRLLTVGMLLTIVLELSPPVRSFPVSQCGRQESSLPSWPPPMPGSDRSSFRARGYRCASARPLMWKPGSMTGFPAPFLMFFIAVAKVGTEGGGQVLLRYMGEQLGMGALVGVFIGLGGGFLLGYANRSGWMAESVQQLGLVTLPILSILACKPVGGSVFIAAYVAGLMVRFGFRDAGISSAEFAEGWGQLFDYFVFFFLG